MVAIRIKINKNYRLCFWQFSRIENCFIRTVHFERWQALRKCCQGKECHGRKTNQTTCEKCHRFHEPTIKLPAYFLPVFFNKINGAKFFQVLTDLIPGAPSEKFPRTISDRPSPSISPASIVNHLPDPAPGKL